MEKVCEIQDYFSSMASPYECYLLALKDREKIIVSHCENHCIMFVVRVRDLCLCSSVDFVPKFQSIQSKV